MSLIINADDLGYSAHRDAGIFEAYSQGAVTAASLMVNGPTATTAAARAGELGLCLGLHLNFTEGAPLTYAPYLTDDGGHMYYKESFTQYVSLETASDNIRQETIAQLHRFKALTGFFPTHVDGHQHVHIWTGMPDLLAPIFQEFGVLSTRIPDEDVSNCTWLSPHRRQRYENRFVMCVRARLIYKAHCIKAPECFIGLGLGGADMTSERITSSLRGTYGITEFMVHPGRLGTSNEGVFSDTFDTDPGRVHELEQLSAFLHSTPLSNWSVFR